MTPRELASLRRRLETRPRRGYRLPPLPAAMFAAAPGIELPCASLLGADARLKETVRPWRCKDGSVSVTLVWRRPGGMTLTASYRLPGWLVLMLLPAKV